MRSFLSVPAVPLAKSGPRNAQTSGGLTTPGAIGGSVAKRIGKFGNDYAPAWCNVGLFYSRDQGEYEATVCAYCGEYASHKEHLVPYSWIRLLSSSVGEEVTIWTWVLPSCAECNMLAGDLLFGSAYEKRRYIQGRLKARHEFNSEPWKDEEIESLGFTLRQYVRAKQAASETVRQRATYSGPLPSTVGSHALNKLAKEAAKRKRRAS